MNAHHDQRTDFRPEIQGLRALAVVLVVVYHLWPGRLTGGFVGVDVFFVISGYLITRHLTEEAVRTGRVRLLRFWARRARRLLPASLLVLAVSLLATWIWLPETVWERTARHVMASAFYVQNWQLAGDAVDYSALNAEATIAQHYWSLSVEEQFYLAWPVLITMLLVVARRFRRQGEIAARPVIAAGLAVAALASLWWSIRVTEADQAVAYFVTPTRVWEFALGGLLGLLWRPGIIKETYAPWAAWVGLVAIGGAALTFDAASAFPGWIALIPVLGTVLVIACAGASSPWGPRWLSWRPVVFVGSISYAVYLWHWPLIIVAPYAVGREMDPGLALAVLGATLLLSWVSTRFVEDPLRTGRMLRSARASFGFAAVGMAIVVAIGFGLVRAVPGEGPPAALPTTTTSCVGPGALDPTNQCPSVLGEEAPRPGPAQVVRQNSELAYPGCQADAEGTEIVSCELGVDAADAITTVAVIGDSHATSWFPVLDALGHRHGWAVRTFTKSSCPPTLALRSVEGETARSRQPDCAAWLREVDEQLRSSGGVDAIFVGSYSTAYSYSAPDDVELRDPMTDGFQVLWQRWSAAGMRVLIFDEVPRTNGEIVPTCLAENDDPMSCAVPVAEALPALRPLTVAASSMRRSGVTRIALRDQFCDRKWCYPVVGSVIVYRDYSHLTEEYAEALAPFIEEQLPKGLTRRSSGGDE